MSRPVTEVVILSLQPGTNFEEPIKALKAILCRQDGFRSMKYGHWEEDKDKVQLMISMSPTPLWPLGHISSGKKHAENKS
jgi:hypothetical protein